jgi:hypothetical protein
LLPLGERRRGILAAGELEQNPDVSRANGFDPFSSFVH